MLKTISKMLKQFDSNDIVYCHWKSNEHIIPALNGDTDLDVLFDYSQRLELEKVLSECGLKRFRATPLMQYNGIEDYIGFDKETAKIWHLHTHYRMTLGEKHLKGYTITPWSKLILDKRVKNENGIYVSSPEDELTLLLCRIALKIRFRDKNKKLGADDKAEIAYLLSRVNKEVFYERAKKFTNREIAEALSKIIKEKLSKKSQFIKLQKQLRKQLKPFTQYSKLRSFNKRTKREIFWLMGGIKRRTGLNNYKANRRISPAGGCVVALLGCDGAGKSTTLNYIKKELNKKIDVVEIYFGSGDGSSSLLRKPMKKIAKKVGGKGVGHKVEKEYSEKKISLKSRLYSCAKIIWAISLAKEKKSKYKKMVKARNNGLLVITDRYPQSEFPGCSDGPLLNKYIDKKGINGAIAKWEKRIYEKAKINPPDLTVKLMVPTDIAIERKPEMTKEEIEQKKKIIEQINISDHSVVIDTSKSMDVTLGEVMEKIWEII